MLFYFCVNIKQFLRLVRFVMVAFYNINDITLGFPSYFGHEAYLNAKYIPDNKKIIYKKNKYGFASFSRLEMSFSQLAKLFLFPGLTPAQYLVKDNNKNIVGIAVQHLGYVVENKEGLDSAFFTFNDPHAHCDTTKCYINDVAKIPIYFLDKLPQGFYAKLTKAEKEGQLAIDYDSLASILATSYTMEEDDLHKGNFGFYLVEKDEKPRVVFFKIDHDLMLVDGVMGFYARRPLYLFHGSGAFDIVAEDLLTFPNLKHSANFYWPTRFSYIAKPFDNKKYHNFAEISAFVRLSTNPAFVKAKWKTFLKQILISKKLIEKTLSDCTDVENSIDRAHMALMTQVMVTRLAHLRAVLFSMKEFRDFVVNMNGEDHEALVQELSSINNFSVPKIKEIVAQCLILCSASGFEEGDTPLHTAIKLGEYRYEESLRMFGRFINIKNKAGKTPLDIAVEQVSVFASKADNDVGADMKFVMKHLLENGAQRTATFKQANLDKDVQSYVFTNPCIREINASLTYSDFKVILRDIGEKHQFCLKYKKNMAIDCIKQWIKVRQSHPNFRQELEQLKKDVNGTSSEAEASEVKYLRQLRSKLWIIRQLRGLYGMTSTQMEINRVIAQARRQLTCPASGDYSFFSSVKQSIVQFDPVSIFYSLSPK